MIKIKVQSEEGEIRRFSSDPSFAALKASLTTRFYEGSGLKVTYRDESDDDVCLSNDEDLQTALDITGAVDGAKTLKLKVKAIKDPVIETQSLANLKIDEQNLPLKKQFKNVVKADPSLLVLMLDPALGAQEKARYLPSAELQEWFLQHQLEATEKLVKLKRKMDCHFGRPGGFGKGKGGGKCGKGKGACDGKGGKGGPYGHHMQHAVHRLQHVLSSQPEVTQQLIAEPQSLQPLIQYPRLHQFCLNHPEVLQEHLNIFRAATPVHQQQQQWVPMRHRIVRYLSNHDEARITLRNDSSSASIDVVMASKPGMLRFLQSSPAELPTLLEEAEAAVAARGANAGAAGVKRPSAGEKKLAEQQNKSKKLEKKQLKVRVKVVKYLTKHQKELEILRADPSVATASTIFAAKPKLNKYLTENADTIPKFVEEAVVMSAEMDTTSSSSNDGDTMEEDAVVITPDMTA